MQPNHSMNPIDPPVISYPEDGSILPVKRYEWRPIELASAEPQPAALAGKKILLIGGASEVIAPIAESLRAYDAYVYHYDLIEDPDDAQLQELKKGIGRLDGMIDFNMEETFSLSDGHQWESAFARTFRVIRAFYQEWAEETDARRLFYIAVTQMGGKMGYGESSLKQPLGGIWAGLAKSLPREIPNCNAKVIDVGPQDKTELGRLLVHELYNWGVFEVGYQEGVRYGLYAEHAPLDSPVLSLDEHDTVLISGGSRGIGFALAQQLARHHGCRVVVTGREALPSEDEQYVALTEDQFKKFQYDRLRSIAPGESVAALRKQFERMDRQRQLVRHMEQVKSEGLRIDYVPCDFTDAYQVAGLVEELGPGLGGVIHNAGIEETVRFNQKRLQDCMATIRIKVNGFIHLAGALQGKKLAFFCSVGSLSGRWGGMVGQIDYSAANEALTRLGFWASGASVLPVQTICWPTWDRLGLITNYRAALKYASAINVEEGIYHWHKNLLSGTIGECIYMGKVGKALVPMQVNGFLPCSIIEAPGIERIHSQVFFLGEVVHFRLFHSIHSISHIDRRTAAFLDDVRLDGEPMIPVSVLLEYGISLAEWVVPEGWLDLQLTSLNQVRFNLQALCFGKEGEQFVLEKKATGQWNGDQWIVNVTLDKPGPDAPIRLGSFQLVYAKMEHAAQAQQAEQLRTDEILSSIPRREAAASNLSSATSWTWSGHVFSHARPVPASDGGVRLEIPDCPSSRLWTVPHLPGLQLPVNVLENMLRAAWLSRLSNPTAATEQLSQLSISCIRLWPTSDSRHYMSGGDQHWYAVNEVGQGIACMEHIIFLGSDRGSYEEERTFVSSVR